MARLFLSSGQSFSLVGPGVVTEVIGTNDAETVDVAANGDALFGASFNRGNDTINILGNAALYTAGVSGSNVVLTSASGANITIPIGTGVTVNFADAAGRNLHLDTVSGNVLLGTQVISTTGSTQVAAGTGDPTPEPSDSLFLTSEQDILTGTTGNDFFLADMVQVGGLQVNSLGTGDNVEGSAGLDTLEAQVTRAATFDGNGGIGINGGSNIAIMPRLNSVEIVKLDAINADLPTHEPYGESGILGEYLSNNTEVYFNAQNVRGLDEIWSWHSDANLTVQNLTTVISGGGHDNARNTSDMTIGMGYTGNQDTNWDASDMHVFFDQDYLLTGQTAQSQAYFFILDQNSDEIGGPLLDNINVDGIIFSISGFNNGQPITLEADAAAEADTHAGFVAALQGALQDLIDAGLVPADTTLTVDTSVTDFTFLDNGAQSSDIPAIVLQTQTAAVITPLGFSQIEDTLGDYNVYGDFTNEAAVEDLPLSVNIALEKAGNGGDGGELIVGSMDKYNHGIDEFNVTVYGDASRPSNLEYLNSTGDYEYGYGQYGQLDKIYISSDNAGFPTDTWASLFVGATNNNMTLIDAQDFFGDLSLGYYDDVANLQTLTATGGGDVEFYGEIYAPNAYTYTTGAGDDYIDLEIDGDALEYATSSLLIDTGAGDDEVYVNTSMVSGCYEADFPNHTILRNVDINTGTGDDLVDTYGDQKFRIDTGSGDDVIYSDQYYTGTTWTFNYDRGAYDNGSDQLSGLPGVPLRYSLLDGATVTVTFSGAGDVANGGGGGGVMELYGASTYEGDAVPFSNGYESSVVINLANNKYYGTQADINAAVVKAINEDAVLSTLLYAWIGANNTLIVQTLIDGSFVTEDLDIDVTRPTLGGAALPSALVQEAITLSHQDSTWADITSATPTGVTGGFADDQLFYGAALNNGFYAGINNNANDLVLDPGNATPLDDPASLEENLYSTGSQGYYEVDNVHTPGAGDDIVVLSTNDDANANNDYWTLDGHLYDFASNETIVLEGADFGDDTIVNFVTAGVEDYVGEVDNDTGVSGPAPHGGFDMLDFTAYLTSMESPSGSVASRDLIPVTLDDQSGGTTPADNFALSNGTIDANEVVVVSLNNTTVAGETFNSLTAADLAAVINNSGTNGGSFGSLDNSELNTNNTYVNTAGVVEGLSNGTGKAIIMVQNDSNLGEYKVFEVTWNGLASASSHTATVTEHGSLDFGTSLVGLDELNLVGSTENALFNVDTSYMIA